ncbi:hypothetical protein [Sinomonas mesophila]|uniref:hypothetical protein n=1 Tax=Sinomonas mesophila TaxID=1531955 RepID=UPI0011157139|nr:hypothetical protein [Sinomonas mesophila]
MARMPAEAQRAAKPSRAARLLAWLFAATSAIVFFGIVDLATLPGWTDPAYEWQVPLDASWGSLFTFVIAAAYASIARRPGSPWPAIVQLGVAAVALGISAALGQDARPVWVGLGVAGTAALLTWLTKAVSEPFPRTTSLDWPLGALALLGLPLWLGFALDALEKSRLVADDDARAVNTLGMDHWPFQAALGLILPVCALLMCVWPPARPLLRVSLSLSAAYVGVAVLAFPDRAGAMPHYLWGVAMVFWGTLLALSGARAESPRGGDS